MCVHWKCIDILLSRLSALGLRKAFCFSLTSIVRFMHVEWFFDYLYLCIHSCWCWCWCCCCMMRSESLCRICVMHKSDFELPICLPHLTISILSLFLTPLFFSRFCSFSFLFGFIVLFGFALSFLSSLLALHSLQHKSKENHVYILHFKLRLLRSLFNASTVLQILNFLDIHV